MDNFKEGCLREDVIYMNTLVFTYAMIMDMLFLLCRKL